MPNLPSNQTMRVFCAVELPDSVRHQVAEHIAALRKAVPTAQAKWERPEKFHITLKFLGERSATDVKALKAATARAAAQSRRFELQIEQTGFFPPRGQPRVLWLGITDASQRLAQMFTALEVECYQEGFPRESRAFHPHLTLARLRGMASDRNLVDAHLRTPFPPISFHVTEIIVMRSELLAGGSRYTRLDQATLPND